MAALGTLGMMAGSLGGGALVDAFGWRAIFLGRVPLCLAAIAFSAALLRLPDDPGRREEPGASRGFDVWGSAALFTAVGALILMLSLGGRNGWTVVYVPLLGVLAVAGIVAFVLAERRAERPILQLSILRNRVLVSALVVAMLAMVSTFVELVPSAVLRGGVAGSERERVGSAADAHDGGHRVVGAAGWVGCRTVASCVHDNWRTDRGNDCHGVPVGAGLGFERGGGCAGACRRRCGDGPVPVGKRQPDNGIDAPRTAWAWEAVSWACRGVSEWCSAWR